MCNKADGPLKIPSIILIFWRQFTGAECKTMTSDTERPLVLIATSQQPNPRFECGLW